MAKRVLAIHERLENDYAMVQDGEGKEPKRYHPDTINQIQSAHDTVRVRKSGSDTVRLEYGGRTQIIPVEQFKLIQDDLHEAEDIGTIVYDDAPVRGVFERFAEAAGRGVKGTVEGFQAMLEADEDPGEVPRRYKAAWEEKKLRDRLRRGTPQGFESDPEYTDGVQKDMEAWEKLTGRPWMNKAEIQALPAEEARAVMAAQGTLFENTYRGVADIGHKVAESLGRAYDDEEPIKAVAGTLASGAGGILPFMNPVTAAVDTVSLVGSSVADPQATRENPAGLALEALGPAAALGGAALARRMAHGKSVTPEARAAFDSINDAANTASARVGQPRALPEPQAAPRPVATAPIVNVADELASIQRTGDVPGSAARAPEAPSAPRAPEISAPALRQDVTPPPVARRVEPEAVTPPRPALAPLAKPGTRAPDLELDAVNADIQRVREAMDSSDRLSLHPGIADELGENIPDPSRLAQTYAQLLVKKNALSGKAGRTSKRAESILDETVTPADRLKQSPRRLPGVAARADLESVGTDPSISRWAERPVTPQSELVDAIADDFYVAPKHYKPRATIAELDEMLDAARAPRPQRGPADPIDLPPANTAPSGPSMDDMLSLARTPRRPRLVEEVELPELGETGPVIYHAADRFKPAKARARKHGPNTFRKDMPGIAEALGFKPEYLRVLKTTLGDGFEQTIRRALDGDEVAMLHMNREYGRVVALRAYMESSVVLADEAVPLAARRVESKAFKNIMRAVVDTEDLLHVNGSSGWASINMPAVKTAKVGGRTMVRVEGDLAKAMPGLGGKWVPIEDARSFAARYGKPNTSWWQDAGRFTKANMTSRRIKTQLVAFVGDMNLQVQDGGSPSAVFSGIKAVTGYSKNSGRSELARFFVRATAGESVSGSMLDRSVTTGPELKSMIESGRLSLRNAHADKRILHDGEMVLRDHLLLSRVRDAAFKRRLGELGRDGFWAPFKEAAAALADSNPALRFLGSAWHIRDAGNRYAFFERALMRELPGLKLDKASPSDIQRIITEKPAEVRRAMAHAEKYGFGIAESSPLMTVADAVVPFMFPRFMAHSTAVMLDSASRWWPKYVAIAKAAREEQKRDPYIDGARMTRRMFGGKARDEFMFEVADGYIMDSRMLTATAVPILMGEFFESIMPIGRDELTGKITIDFGPIQQAVMMGITGKAPDGTDIYEARSPTGEQHSREQAVDDILVYLMYVGSIRGITPGLYADFVDAGFKAMENQRWLERAYTPKEALARAVLAVNPEPSAANQSLRFNAGLAPQTSAANRQRLKENKRQPQP